MDDRVSSLFDQLMEPKNPENNTPSTEPNPSADITTNQSSPQEDGHTLDISEMVAVQKEVKAETKNSITVEDYAVYNTDGDDDATIDIVLPPYATRSNTVTETTVPLPSITPASEAADVSSFTMEDYVSEDVDDGEDLDQMVFGSTVADSISEDGIASIYIAEEEPMDDSEPVPEQHRLSVNLNLFEDVTPVEDLEDPLASLEAPERPNDTPEEIVPDNTFSLSDITGTTTPQETATTSEAPTPVTSASPATPTAQAATPTPEQTEKRRKRLSDGVMADPRIEQKPFEYTFEKPKKKKKSFFRNLVELVFMLAFAFLVATAINTFLLINARIPSESMLPTVEIGDRIFGNRLAYLNSDPKRGDIIIFAFPDNPERTFIKRIIGLPGDTVQVIDGVVYITSSEGGEPVALDEPYILDEEPNSRCKNYGPVTVPENSYFVMGDNRNGSNDSRFWSNPFVSRDAIYAKAVLRYWPLDRINLMD